MLSIIQLMNFFFLIYFTDFPELTFIFCILLLTYIRNNVFKFLIIYTVGNKYSLQSKIRDSVRLRIFWSNHLKYDVW